MLDISSLNDKPRCLQLVLIGGVHHEYDGVDASAVSLPHRTEARLASDVPQLQEGNYISSGSTSQFPWCKKNPETSNVMYPDLCWNTDQSVEIVLLLNSNTRRACR